MRVDKNERHGGSDESDIPLLGKLEGGACREGDVVIGGKLGDQGNHNTDLGLEPSLAIEKSTAAQWRAAS